MPDKKKEPMIGKGERPGQLDLDRPLSEIKLRDLVTALGVQAHIPERIKPEWWKPEGWKPEFIKPEFIKPEILKERIKPELTKPPFEIDEMFDPVLETLSKDQLQQLAGNIQRRLQG